VQTILASELGKDPIAPQTVFLPSTSAFTSYSSSMKATGCGLFTISDIERILHERTSVLKPARDDQFRLLCGAAVTARATRPANSTATAFSTTSARSWNAASMPSPSQPRTA